MRNICRRATGIVVADGPALDAFVEIFRDLPPEAAVCPISTVALLTASTACKAGTISPLELTLNLLSVASARYSEIVFGALPR